MRGKIRMYKENGKGRVGGETGVREREKTEGKMGDEKESKGM